MMKLCPRFVQMYAMLLVLAASNFTQSGENRARQSESAKVEGAPMILARFHAGEGKEDAVAFELHDAVVRVSKSPIVSASRSTARCEIRRCFFSISPGSMRQHSTGA
jgi:hypothetical protein